MSDAEPPPENEQKPIGIDFELLESLASNFLKGPQRMKQEMKNEVDVKVEVEAEEKSIPAPVSPQQTRQPAVSASNVPTPPPLPLSDTGIKVEVPTFPGPLNPGRRSPSQGEDLNSARKFFAYCCQYCKNNDKKRKTCVCVVPATQRRVIIGPQGCSTCGCKGCTKEDIEMRNAAQASANAAGPRKESSEDVRSDSGSLSQGGGRHERRFNGCCRRCIKAFSKSGRACLCQVPKAVRKVRLPDSGCKFCGCHGCNPEDVGRAPQRPAHEENQRGRTSHRQDIISSGGLSEESNGEHDRSRSRSRDRSSYYSNSDEDQSKEEEREPIKWSEMNFDNLSRSPIGIMIANQFGLYPPLIGFGIPQRTPNYILGRPADRREFD
eukprot:TRINITY_DN8429_c0_g1_i2.p1 TRINITY_DN8429_c0_g1~~TRINITY_DN8429_c0_g1_i2.p1  ORF type:complete len:379 (-),score=48.09 TRINITY_DN8429_c0_g1_i2:129-1265(-)